MKNRTLKSLSVLLSICLLGTSPVSATDFSDGSDFTEDSTQAQTDTNSAVADPTSTDDFSADDATDDTALLILKTRFSLMKKRTVNSLLMRWKQKKRRLPAVWRIPSLLILIILL